LLLLEGAVRNDSVTAVCERAKHPHRELFEMPAGFLEQYGQFDRGAAAAAVLNGQVEPEPSVLRQRLIGFARRLLLSVTALGILPRTNLAKQLLKMTAQGVLLGSE